MQAGGQLIKRKDLRSKENQEWILNIENKETRKNKWARTTRTVSINGTND